MSEQKFKPIIAEQKLRQELEEFRARKGQSGGG